jgi:hypothetical protein
MDWATFWVTFSQTHLVTLLSTVRFSSEFRRANLVLIDSLNQKKTSWAGSTKKLLL